jgi:hypothetical protein
METRTEIQSAARERLALAILAMLGALVWLIALTHINIADGDLWAKMSLGAMLLQKGVFLIRDIFAFTPVLPRYVDHEWGSGVVFFGVLNLFGPAGLMVLKIALATGALLAAAWTARRQGCSWHPLLLLLPVAAWALLPGYGGVIRSHAFTYAFFALALLMLEELRRGRVWWGVALVSMTALWTNLHGGFVAGLGLISVYAAWACVERKKAMLVTAAGCWLATLINPNGYNYWQVLLPALAHPRPEITEWQSLPLLGSDVFVGFRVCFLVTLLSVAGGWRHVEKRSWPGLFMLLLTAYLGWKSRRHASFFAVTALAIGTPYLQALLQRWLAVVPEREGRRALARIATLAVVYVGLALWAFARLLPYSSFQVLAPVGIYPVREVDVLEQAGIEGNAAVPFHYGSYVSWRLYPKVKVSMDGRYEAAYPESTFRMNQDFFGKRGQDWDRLILRFRVDFIILDYTTARLRPEDLVDKGYELICQEQGISGLLALKTHAPFMRETFAKLPPTTPDPLSADIPRKWPLPEPLSNEGQRGRF